METPAQTSEKFLSKVLNKEGIAGVLLVLLIVQNFWLEAKRAEREERRQEADRQERTSTQEALLNMAQIGASAARQASDVASSYERTVQDNTRVMERIEWRLAHGGVRPPARERARPDTSGRGRSDMRAREEG
jgi:hypothetical protein